jgi:hypothetical protein
MVHANSAALRMTASQVVTIQPTAEEWLEIAEPGVKKATLAMFRGVHASYTLYTPYIRRGLWGSNFKQDEYP